MNEKEGYVPIEVILELIEKHLKQCSSGERLRFALGISKIIGDLDIPKPNSESEPTKPKVTKPNSEPTKTSLRTGPKKRKVNLV